MPAPSPVNSATVITPLDNPTRFSEVLATIGRTQKMMVLSGENVGLAAGLLPVSAPLPGQRTGQGQTNTLRGLLVECSPTTIAPDQLPAERLAALNLAMTRRRIAARSAELTKFHHLLGRLFDEGRLISYLTESFDGIEERSSAGFSDRVVMLYGDNRLLRCCMPRCCMTLEDAALELDTSFLASERVLCADCCRANTKTSKERRKGTDATRALRPAVQGSLGAQMLVGEDRQAMKEAAGKCQLLLILGISLKDPEILDLTRELGEVIRSNYGGVVYVSPQALRGGQSTYDHIDFHLKVEPEVAIDGISSALDKANDESMLVDGEDHTADMWFDCPSLFCYRRADYLAELNAGNGQSTLEPQANNNNNNNNNNSRSNSNNNCQNEVETFVSDSFTFDLACLVFNRYADEGPKRTLESIKADFLCPDCWEYNSAGLYPHFVRAMPRVTIERPGQPLPRMVLLVYYLEQFWPAAKQLCTSLGGRWKNNGWPCHIVPIKLESLAEQQDVLSDLTWEEQSFDVMVIYLMHGLSGEQGYQVGHELAYRAVEFFDQTLKVSRGLLDKARTKRAFLMCCGYPLLSPQMVKEMQVWIDGPGTLDSIVGCLNRRMSPGFMVNMISKLSTHLLEQDEWAWEVMFETWLTDSIARTHSDLLCLAPGRSAEMWLYAPFQSRPLGKPLPDLLQVCNCPKLVGDSSNISAGAIPRKQWKVTHEGKAGRSIRDLKNMGGQYGVRVLYFVAQKS
ncbi:unnamed protein product [Rhizoctonia solani]|uniref:Deacetylase sirtuin-type domain-containing protein n=1 Tax=Rhizoctonia solani TaxID=456999 RepID=A0A8H3CQ47_9AGAM|nr:unnamed protein product [Rhizoctonia solani]